MNSWEDHEPVEIDGWIQVGSITGTKYGTWVREINGNRHSITSSQTADGYWLKINNIYFGRHVSPQKAARKSDKHDPHHEPPDPPEAETER